MFLYLSFFSTSSWWDDSNLSHFSLSVFNLVKVTHGPQFGAGHQCIKGKVKGKEPKKTSSRNSSWIIDKWNVLKVTRPLLSESNIYIKEVWLGFTLYLFLVSVSRKPSTHLLQRTSKCQPASRTSYLFALYTKTVQRICTVRIGSACRVSEC